MTLQYIEKSSNLASLSSSRDDEAPTAAFYLGRSEMDSEIIRILPKFSVPQPSPATPFDPESMRNYGGFEYTVTNFAGKSLRALISPNQQQTDSTRCGVE